MATREIGPKAIEKYKARVRPGKKSDCWEWPHHRDRIGYGLVTFWCPAAKNTRCVLAHRASYVIAKGPIPDGLDVMHLCHNKACTNPAHLDVGTRTANLKTTIDDGKWPRLVPLADHATILARYLAGERIADIAEGYRCVPHTIYGIIRRNYTPSGDLRRRTIQRSEHTKIKRLRRNGSTFQSIADVYGVSESAIRRIFYVNGWAS